MAAPISSGSQRAPLSRVTRGAPAVAAGVRPPSMVRLRRAWTCSEGLQARQEIATLAQLGNASFDVTGDAVRFDIELHQALSNDMDHVPEQIGILSHA